MCAAQTIATTPRRPPLAGLALAILISGACAPVSPPVDPTLEPVLDPEVDQVADPVAIEPFPGVVVRIGGPAGPAVEIEAMVCLDLGWLEQVACSPASREHESLVVVRARPSEVHAALLMAGFEPGRPGQWSWEGDRLSFEPPKGARIDVSARYPDASGAVVETPIRRWIRDAIAGDAFPDEPWIFGGSTFAKRSGTLGGEELYVADVTGSIIGLVTFGDEVLGFSRVWADEAQVQPPEWEVNPDAVPPLETRVTLVLRAYDDRN